MTNNLRILSIVAILIISFINQSLTIVRTEENSEWDRESLTAYFKKYRLQIDKNTDYNALVDTIKSYKNAVTANSRIFGSNIEQIFSGFKPFLESDTKDLFMNLKYQLRKLELKGQLTKERVQEVFQKAHHLVINKELMTQQEWDKAYSYIESAYTKPTLYQRVFHHKPDIQNIESSSLKKWVHITTSNLAHLGILTKEQIEAVSETIYQSVLNSDLSKLGERAWSEDLSHTISQKTEIKKEQLEKIVRYISNQVRAYKIFAIDYTDQANEQMHYWADDLKKNWNKLYEILEPIKSQIFKNKETTKVWHFYRDSHLKYPGQEQKLKEYIRAQTSSMAKAVKEQTDNLVTSAAPEATESIKGGFSHFWSQKEHAIYRKLGYTEAHVDWIKNYLEQTFQNKKNLVKEKTNEASATLKHYLNSCKIQTPNQVDANVHRMKRYLESWTKH